MIDGVRATMFYGNNAIMGDSREVWFIKGGALVRGYHLQAARFLARPDHANPAIHLISVPAFSGPSPFILAPSTDFAVSPSRGSGSVPPRHRQRRIRCKRAGHLGCAKVVICRIRSAAACRRTHNMPRPRYSKRVRSSDTSRRHVAIHLSLGANENDAVAGRIARVPFHLVIRNGNFRAGGEDSFRPRRHRPLHSKTRVADRAASAPGTIGG